MIATLALSLAVQDTVDRSAEPELRILLQKTAAWRKVEFEVIRTAVELQGQSPLDSGTLHVWYDSPGKFRVYYNDTMGEAALFVGDGESTLYDTMGDPPNVTLSKATLTFDRVEHDLWGNMSVILRCTEGPSLLEKFISKTRPIVKKGDAIEFSTEEGTVRLFANDDGSVGACEIERRPGAAPSFRQPNYLIRDKIEHWGPLKSRDKGLFSTAPPDGATVTDTRKDG